MLAGPTCSRFVLSRPLQLARAHHNKSVWVKEREEEKELLSRCGPENIFLGARPTSYIRSHCLKTVALTVLCTRHALMLFVVAAAAALTMAFLWLVHLFGARYMHRAMKERERSRTLPGSFRLARIKRRRCSRGGARSERVREKRLTSRTRGESGV